MENEKKIEENKIEEAKAGNASEEKVEKVEDKVEESKCEKKKCCGKKFCPKHLLKNKNNIAIAVLVILIAASAAYKYLPKKTDIGPVAAKAKVEKFINENLLQAGTTANVGDATEEAGLYKMVVKVGTQEVVTYVTKDGTKFFPQAFEMEKAQQDDAANKQAAAPEKAEAEAKADVPTVDLFVMSYCPFGLQMERGLLPAVEALGNKIKFNLKFVDYTLHGQKEVEENVRQYCVQKTQPAKLDAYLKCFWKDSKGKSDACLKAVGINAAQVSSCVADTNKQFNPTEKSFPIDKEENDKFGVQGSPTLVVNGTTVSSGRDSASVLKAICSGFTNQPKECQAKLSATSPAAGFDDQAAGNGGASAPASCH